METDIFPEGWKRYTVRPIFKKGSRVNVKNYRCIAKLQTIAKFFEHCVNVQFTRIVSPYISPNQYGFMKNRSPNINLMDLIHYAINGLNECNRVDVLYLDLSKAFDRVNDGILIQKLSWLRIPTNATKWIKSYLANRRQLVKLGGAESTEFIVNSGVAQGNHIGPTLFLLFINDPTRVATKDIFCRCLHIEMIVARATSAHGIVKRFCYEINDQSTLRAVYSALVQLHLEYNRIWNCTIALVQSHQHGIVFNASG